VSLCHGQWDIIDDDFAPGVVWFEIRGHRFGCNVEGSLDGWPQCCMVDRKLLGRVRESRVDDELPIGCKAGTCDHWGWERAIQQVAETYWVRPVELEGLVETCDVHEQACRWASRGTSCRLASVSTLCTALIGARAGLVASVWRLCGWGSALLVAAEWRHAGFLRFSGRRWARFQRRGGWRRRRWWGGGLRYSHLVRSRILMPEPIFARSSTLCVRILGIFTGPGVSLRGDLFGSG